MGTEQKTHFKVDKSKCIRCGKCINTCSGMVIVFGKDGYPEMKGFERYGWRGCWRCQHCLAVCPVGAISIFDKKPEDSLPPVPPEMGGYMEQLIVNRRSCRRFLKKNVEPEVISGMLCAMSAAPTGGNSCNVEYTVIDDMDRVHEIWKAAYSRMDEDAKKHIYTRSFSDFYYDKMKKSEKTVRKDDLLFCGAPHLFIAHERCVGKWAEDSKVNCIIATAYFELLCNAHGLGSIIMSYPAEVLNELAPEARKMLGIPADHYTGLMVGFGYPEIEYARGVQKDRGKKIHRYTDGKKMMKAGKKAQYMDQAERRRFLITELLKEQSRYGHMEIPQERIRQEQLLRSLMNIRMPGAVSQRFLEVQDAYLREEISGKGITDLKDLKPVSEGIYLWQGDITTFRCDATVNAANSGMTGCYAPCHGCIDNCIHTCSGIQLRMLCAEIMKRQGHEEETGKAKITPAFNLPCRYIIHTVGPVISGRLTERDKELLVSCYRSCLELAEENELGNIAFCCISTGEFHFPNDAAAEIAVQTVREYKNQTHSRMEMIFNVFKDVDHEIYKERLVRN